MSNSEWKFRPLGEVTYEQTSRAGKSLNGLPVYGVDSKIGLTSVPKYVAEKLDKYKVIEPGMFAYKPMRLNIGSIGLCKHSYAKGLVSPDYVVFGCDTENLLPEFLNYAIQGLEWRQWTSAAGVGSVRVRIYYKELARLSMTIPPIAAQKSIVKILSTLDDKIELNRQINQTLEQITQAIFKSWFVDFEPVNAKIEAKAAGLDPERAAMCAISGKLEPELDQLPPVQYQQLAATAAMFTDELVESELGLIPEGWEVGNIYNVVEVIYGAPFASAKFNSDGVGKPLIRIRDLKDEAPGLFTPEIHPKGYLVQPGDIVVGMDGEFRAYLWGGKEAWLNQRVCVFKPKTDVSAAFVRGSIMPCLAAVEASETATTVIHLGKNDIDRFMIVIPELGLIEAFGAVVDPMYAQIVSLKQSSRILATLRDTLLPKLLSGEISLMESSLVVEGAINA